jgi:hypothetical protein
MLIYSKKVKKTFSLDFVNDEFDPDGELRFRAREV